jgi:hypothetical protein
MRFEIDSNKAVLVFVDGQEAPVLFQPYDPSGDGTPFATKAEATAWAKAFVKTFLAERELAPEVVEVAPEPIEG